MIQLGVIQAIEQMNRPWARGRQANPDLTGELGVPASHERRHLLMAGLDEAQLILVTTQRAENAVDPVAREPIDRHDVPVDQSLAQVVSRGLGHQLLRS
jgi:hypothetical protein